MSSSTLDRLRLDGKVAVVTGGAGAIGQVYGRALAEAGAAVVLADLDGARAESAAATLASDGLQALGVQTDITDRASTADMAAKSTAAFGGIDILVNNAALMAEIPQVDILDLPTDWFDRVMRVNVLGAVLCAGAVKASMTERGGGRIINQVSAGAFMGGGIYGVSKLALVNITVGLARSLGPLGINVNAIAPGLVENEPGLRSLPADHPARAALTAAIPGKKSAPAEDLLGTLLLLASPAGEWINGQVISVDGGWVTRL
ncbi:SDR family oxidoreductase [Streptomyces griseoruber]|uniref:Short-chain dehydrogenase n=1 Tax=Streptomyces griseoruber TaxID=1943 RepID=A0A101SV61_9ACTN|nr:SDR family oxidoreductase [Streptomyces griseoruber]KUN80780.1 short-chain dehydrogenase [Streptomyces griseoruber]